MVSLTAYMIATTAMVMGIDALGHASAEKIKSVLKASHVLPAAHSASGVISSVAPSGVSNKKKLNKRAIYNMDGEYSESVLTVSPLSNVYSALDIASLIATPAASASASVVYSQSVKAALKARGAAISSVHSDHHASAPYASASVAHLVSPIICF
jgi:hypothetical protein